MALGGIVAGMKPKRDKRTTKLWLIIFVLILISLSLTYKRTPPITSSTFKTFTNDNYHVRLDIPESWTISEFQVNKPVYEFSLTSEDNQVVIYSYLPMHLNTGKMIDETETTLGQYPAKQFRFEQSDGTINHRYTLTQPDQKAVHLVVLYKDEGLKHEALVRQVLDSFAYTQKEQGLTELIDFTIPTGWAQEQKNPNEAHSDTLSFHSASYVQSHDGFTGARIEMTRAYKSSSFYYPAEQFDVFIDNELYPYSNVTEDLKTVQVGNKTGRVIFTCNSGCTDTYFVDENTAYWRVTFYCDETCANSRGMMKTSQHEKDRDAFLSSLIFN